VTYMCRGIQLPPRGSLAEKAMVEMLERERDKDVSKFELEITLQGLFAGVDSKDMTNIVDIVKREYRSRVNQTIYSAGELTKRMRGELGKIRRDASYLKKLEEMTVH
jgi:uncharacterized protein YeeX (DUF496 family)